ncbi:cyclic peptide export ABC transporter [Starkeya koreensis]|uniref:Cyclic peptide export ABC transporter n=1 Tax=Ancylobacter koreensis TaxID=266121 RepID=A0ABT0DQB4_9HYPH|nr:cyclic peptide export ABC transporter [Ancylobacter koreensis]MCK0209463.1 cyclic peptide export ABC transporter [Ancylobacter koreensis]
MTSRRELLAPFALPLAAAGLLGALASAATVALLATTNSLLAQAERRPDELAVFGLLCLVAFGGNALADMLTNRAGQHLVARLRRSLAERILAAPLDALERYRTHRLMPVLTGDIDAVSDLAFLFAPLAIAGAVILGCVGYLVWLSPPLAFLVCALAGAGSVAVYATRLRGVAGFWQARESEDALHKSYRTLIEGARELRLSRNRRSELLDGAMAPTIETIRRVNTRAINVFVLANAAGSTLYFAVIALVAAGGAWLQVEDAAVLTGTVLVLLYMKGPIDQIMQALPPLVRAQISLRRVAELNEAFAAGEAPGDEVPTATSFGSLELSGVRYAYPAPADGEAFALGPLDLAVKAGETVFVVGSNGAGKTTLINLLLGLHAPQAGELRLDGRPVDAAGRDAYRQTFSAVLSDYFLFETLPAGADPDAARAHIDWLGLGGKLSVEGGRLSTLDLSSGQKKRLALVHACLEDRPVMVFDEWAADQDPRFRRMFYETVLPELKRRGRTLIVISHDDRYFHIADRLVRLEAGRIVPATAEAGR